jgi:hypothetical protein
MPKLVSLSLKNKKSIIAFMLLKTS